MVAVVLSQTPILQFFGNDGAPAVGGSVLTQIGNVNALTYSDSAGTVPLPNPIPLNSRGEISTAAGASAQLFLPVNAVYTFTLFDQNGIQLWAAPYIDSTQITAAQIGLLLYPQTATELSLSVVPTNYLYPEGDPRRYGADPSGVSDSTAAVQTAINVESVLNGRVYIAGGCNYLTGALLWQATAENSGIYIEGAGSGGSRLTYSATTGTHLSFLGTAADIAGNVASTVHITFRGVTMVGTGSGNSTNGVLLQALSQWIFDDVVVVNYGNAYNLSSALVGDFWSCIAENCKNGYISSKLGSNEACNDISIREGRVIGCTTWGFDIGNGQGWTIDGTDVESNGTAGNPATGAIMLRASTSTETGIAIFDIRAWIEQNHSWSLYAENNSGLQLSMRDRVITSSADSSFTAAIAGTALTVSGSVTGIPLAIGMYLSGDGITPGTNLASGSGSSWVVNILQTVSSEAMTATLGGVINIQGALSVEFDNVRTGSSLTDVAIINSVVARVTNSVFSNWTDTGVTYPYYEGALLNLGSEQDGRLTAQAWTMTGGSTGTGTVGIYQQGHDVVVTSGAQITSSGGTATTISIANAVPSGLHPEALRSGLIGIINNGVQGIGTWTLSTGGTLTITNAGGNFTNAGVNGVPQGANFTYSI